MKDGKERKAVIYARIASSAPVPAEDRAFTLVGQERCCREHAKENGYAAVAVFKDVGSGNATDRPGFNAMLAFLREQREAHTVLVDGPSRLARDTGVFMKLCRKIERSGGLVEVSGSEGFLRTKADRERERD